MKLKDIANYRLVILALSLLLAPNSALAACKQTVDIVVLGDSLVAGYGLAPGDAFPEKIEKELLASGWNVKVNNAGVSGDTTTGGLARLDWSVPDETDLVVLELGANDALRGIPVALTRKNLDEMIARLKGRNIDVLLAGMLAPPNMGPEYGDSFRAIYSDLASKHQITLYPFFLDGVAADPELNQPDGIHPNREGIDRIVERIMPTVVNEIDKTCDG